MEELEQEENLNEISIELFDAELNSNSPQDNYTNKLKSDLFSIRMPRQVRFFLIIAVIYLLISSLISCFELFVNVYSVVILSQL